MELVDRLYKQLELLSQHKDFNESCTIIDMLDAINKIKELEAKLAESIELLIEADSEISWQAGASTEKELKVIRKKIADFLALAIADKG